MTRKKISTLKIMTQAGEIRFTASPEIAAELQEDDGKLEMLLLRSLELGLRTGLCNRHWLKASLEEIREAEAKQSEKDAYATAQMRLLIKEVMRQKPKPGRGRPKAIESLEASEIYKVYGVVKKLMAEGDLSEQRLAEQLNIGGEEPNDRKRGLKSYLKVRGTTYKQLEDDVANNQLFGYEIW